LHYQPLFVEATEQVRGNKLLLIAVLLVYIFIDPIEKLAVDEYFPER
jgi:hypothetical protein